MLFNGSTEASRSFERALGPWLFSCSEFRLWEEQILFSLESYLGEMAC